MRGGLLKGLKRCFVFCKWQIQLSLYYLAGSVFYLVPDLLRYRKLAGEKYKRLLIVAHPDDETLFFSRVLLSHQNDLVVFCLSNGYNPGRRREFFRAMEYCGVRGYMMKLPDQMALSFLFNSGSIAGKLRKLKRSFPACETVYTHNLEGEYGHRHHRLVGRQAVRLFNNATVIVPASRCSIGEEENRLRDGQLACKEYIFSRFYVSQVKDVKESLSEWFYFEKLSKAGSPFDDGKSGAEEMA